MIVVNYPSSVLVLLLREFLVFMCIASKTKPNKQKKQYFFFFPEFMDHSKVRFASILDRINSSSSLKSLLDLTFFCSFSCSVKKVPCAVALLLPLLKSDNQFGTAAWHFQGFRGPSIPKEFMFSSRGDL